MIEAPVPNYEAVPCRPIPGARRSCMSNPGQPCATSSGSHRARRLLWAAMLDAQSRGETHLWWYGYGIQVTTPLRVR